jgi:hypothetical protein
MQEEVIATIRQNDSSNLLEVALVQDGASGPRVELRVLSWGTGLGWYRQHTLRLDRTAARALLHTFDRLQRRLERSTFPALGRQIIPSPGIVHPREETERQVLPPERSKPETCYPSRSSTGV